MDLTTIIVTKNNQRTIEKAIKSVINLGNVLIADLGSTDNTIDLCEHHQAKVFHLKTDDRSEARNFLIDKTSSEYVLSIHPYEALIQNESMLQKTQKHDCNLTIINNNIVTKECRFWKKEKNITFVNPFFEYPNFVSSNFLNVLIYNSGMELNQELLDILERWSKINPLSIEPYYYKASTLFALKKLDQFLVASEYCMFLDKTNSTSSIMNRYNYSIVQLFKKNYKVALQNLNICISEKPLMAEFWCLTGDVHYHLLNRFKDAKEFYEIAIELGSKRLNDELFPMDISKYDEYPRMMIESCEKLYDFKNYFL